MAFTTEDILNEFAEAAMLGEDWRSDNDLLLFQLRLRRLEQHRAKYQEWIANPVNRQRKKAYQAENWPRWQHTEAKMAANKRYREALKKDPVRLEAWRAKHRAAEEKRRQDPEYLARTLARHRVHRSKPETKEYYRERARRPDVRAKNLENQRKRRQRERETKS